jgi:hypothetical protein
MTWKKLKKWWQKKVKKSKKDNTKDETIESKSVEIDEIDPLEETEREKVVADLMDQILSSDLFQETFERLSKPITMLLPHEGKNAFYFFSPTLQTFRLVRAPTEVTVIEESKGGETLCIIHNVPYLVPDKYLKNVGYN